MALGYGPLVECTTVTNVSSQKPICPFDHRNENGELVQPLMKRLECQVKFRVYEPEEEYRSRCPYILITSSGAHTHPIPLPTKTPPSVRSQVFQLLDDLAEDMPEITPRRFLRHPQVKSFLAAKFPHIKHPTLSNLHVSLSNRSHLQAYIKQAKEVHCPYGTGWEAIVRLKALQDEKLHPSEHYIRRIIVLDNGAVDHHEEDDDDPSFKDDKLRIIVCMSPKASARLLERGSYLQSDIAFKRIIDFLEFEMACMDRDANTSLVFCRVFLNRQSAAAHLHVFSAIEDIVFQDTGRRLKWRHLHAEDLDEHEGMILQWGADQHRGQAKGLGLHLQALAAKMPVKQDLHQPERTIQSLTPYEHLHRTFRLCSNHYYRNINTCPVSCEVKRLMRSLLCMEHVDWDGTVAAIEEKGGKAGRDWLKDKQSTHFAFQAICWERSFIPWAIWKAGDSHTNLVESVHRDVNHHGVHCSLYSALQKGQAFDSFKMRTLEVFETYGVRPTYRSGHISENAFTNLRRRDNAQRRILLAQDQIIMKYNHKLTSSYEHLLRSREKIVHKLKTNYAHYDISDQVQKLVQTAEKALEAYNKVKMEGVDLLNTGTGKSLIYVCQLHLLGLDVILVNKVVKRLAILRRDQDTASSLPVLLESEIYSLLPEKAR
ncbi:hypothetical protein B0H15DRAFT_798446 [Mycena belliarum]|uniref:Uncharacterized protein n=1 Tax=Mycena belliarum TaxID=1033014 RepID=A0AAD6U8G1_9AGAR|nr:hypothetical protein B0H15DRAFT_798446 [Mycena belliae]